MNTKPFTPERLQHIRRLRKARRFFKHQPLFAFDLMLQQYPGYTYTDFLDDLRRRSKKKKRFKKSPLVRYGRYSRMEKLLQLYIDTKEHALALKVIQLRKRMTKPYQVLVRLHSESLEYTLSPLIPIKEIEELVIRLRVCTTQHQADEMVQQVRNNHPIL